MRAKLLFIGLFVTILSSSSSALAQSSTKDEVVLTVSGEGKTTDEATKVALRSAISQAYGVFVSANTTLLNDDLVKDEIVTLTNGNIKNYEEVTNITLPDGEKSVTLKATVCISKLVSYAKSKGASTEFEGATFAMNMKMKELNKANETKAFEHLLDVMAATLPFCYDLNCEIGEPSVSQKQGSVPTYDIPLVVTFTPTQTALSLENILVKSLESISLTQEEFDEYNRLNLKPTRTQFFIKPSTDSRNPLGIFPIRLRNSTDWVYCLKKIMRRIVALEALNFNVVDNVGNVTSFIPVYYDRNGVVDPRKIDINTKKVSPIEFIFERDKGFKFYKNRWSPYVGGGNGVIFDDISFNSTQVLFFTMRIPQADISKYSTFEVKRAYDYIEERLIKQLTEKYLVEEPIGKTE